MDDIRIIVMGAKNWYADAQSALNVDRKLILAIPPPRAVRLRKHLMAFKERTGTFKNAVMIFRELKFHVLFFRATINHSLGIAIRQEGDAIEVRMRPDIQEGDATDSEIVIVPAHDWSHQGESTRRRSSP